MSNALVSAIVPVYNGERFLRPTLESILEQDYRPLEVIVVDDGSTDRSAEIIRSVDAVHYVHQENQGVAQARNAGLGKAQGDHIAFLDQDDMWTPDKLSVQVSQLRQDSQIEAVMSRMQFFLEPGVERPDWLRDGLLSESRPGYNLGATLVRRSVFDRVGVFDPQFTYGSDHDWFVRAKDANVRIAFLDEVHLHKRAHDSNESERQAMDEGREYLRIYRASFKRQKAHDKQPSGE